MRRIFAALVLLIALVACSEPSDEGALVAGPGATAGSEDADSKNEANDAKKKGGTRDREGGGGDENKRGGRNRADSSGNDASASNDDDGPSSGAGGARTRATRPPSVGTYTYAQEGWEEMCQAGACDRADLPPEQRVSVEHQAADGSTFTTTTRGAGAREQSITYSLGRDRLLIRRITSDFQFGAFRTRTEIVPDPPILTARLPFRVGNSWSGEWKDRGGEIDGSYDFQVKRREPAGQRNAFVVDMSMTFRGTYRGSSEIRLWVDPRDVTILASRGRTEITGDFGTYRTKATTSLTDRP